MATLAQLEANRRNALQSTGPRSPEGKEASRRNALKHGLAARTLVLPDDEAGVIADRLASWGPILRPRDDREGWLVEEVVVNSVRVERCQAHETALRCLSAGRATISWDADRRAEAEALGGKLSRSPSIVSRELRRTKRGCAWLIARWEGLAAILDAGGEWDGAQKKLALDLLGTPKEFRNGPTPLDGDRVGLVAEQLEELEADLDAGLEGLDEVARASAEIGFGTDMEKTLWLIRRYEMASFRRMERAMNTLYKDQPPARRQAPAGSPPVATPTPAPALAVEVAKPPEPKARELAPAPAPLPSPPILPPVTITRPAATKPPVAENRRTRRARKALARRA